MTLPKPSKYVHTHTVILTPDAEVSFQIVPLPGARYQQLVDECRDPDTGKTPWANLAVPLLTESVTAVYSSLESTPVEFTAQDAEEIWEEWPEWARWDIFATVLHDNTQGPASDPFTTSKRKEPDGN